MESGIIFLLAFVAGVNVGILVYARLIEIKDKTVDVHSRHYIATHQMKTNYTPEGLLAEMELDSLTGKGSS